MGKFNEKQTIGSIVRNHPDAVTNFEGGPSYKLPALWDLYVRVSTALMGEDKFYQSAQEADNELVTAIKTAIIADPEFVLKLAVYAREKLYLRSVTTVLLAELANAGIALPDSRKTVARCIKRPDDMTELVAYQLRKNRLMPRVGKLPMLIKNGIAQAYPKFDAYQLAKYNRDGDVKLKDVMFLTHPKPTAELAPVWQKLIDGNLESPETWEVMRSTGKMNWHQVINDVFNKGGKTNNYMAIIRNLKNCLMAKDVTSDDRALLARMIQDEQAVRYAKILPFRFFSAYTMLRNMNFAGQDNTEIYEALEKAAQISIGNVPKLPGRTVIAIDTSGSMKMRPISDKSSVTPAHISVLLGMMARSICQEAMTCTFDTSMSWVNLPDKTILRNAYDTRAPGGATYGHLVLQSLIKRKLFADRVIFLTDMVLYGSENFAELWTMYNQMTNAKLYNVNLAGYGLTSVARNMPGSRNIAGWSDRIFEMINCLERGSDVIDEIRAI